MYIIADNNELTSWIQLNPLLLLTLKYICKQMHMSTPLKFIKFDASKRNINHEYLQKNIN